MDADTRSADDGRLAMLNDLCAAQPRVVIAGMEMIVGTMEAVWAARVLTVWVVPRSYRKAVLDVAHYDSLPLDLTADVRALAELFRRDAMKTALSIVSQQGDLT
jgi:hypothetical protein